MSHKTDYATAPTIKCHYQSCGKSFRQKNYNQRFCSGKCRNAHFNELKAEAMAFYREAQKQSPE
jgi:endogenous inhibitor of DNA gyrase (YacG/DUF329 family)